MEIAGERSERSANLERGKTDGTANALVAHDSIFGGILSSPNFGGGSSFSESGGDRFPSIRHP
jgi:hypothetical protein